MSPRAQLSAPSPAPSPKPVAHRVLVIEDDPSIAHIVVTALRRADFAVGVAATPRAADRRLSSERFDLLVTDLRLPQESGLTFVRRLRQLGGPVGGHRHVPVVMISGAQDDGCLQQMAAAGVSAHVQKPFRPETMLATVQRLLEAERALPFTHHSTFTSAD